MRVVAATAASVEDHAVHSCQARMMVGMTAAAGWWTAAASTRQRTTVVTAFMTNDAAKRLFRAASTWDLLAATSQPTPGYLRHYVVASAAAHTLHSHTCQPACALAHILARESDTASARAQCCARATPSESSHRLLAWITCTRPLKATKRTTVNQSAA